MINYDFQIQVVKFKVVGLENATRLTVDASINKLDERQSRDVGIILAMVIGSLIVILLVVFISFHMVRSFKT